MTRLTKGRKTPLVDSVSVTTRLERLTRDNAKSLGLNQSEILREALEQAVEVAMRELNYKTLQRIEFHHPEQSSWLSNLKWW